MKNFLYASIFIFAFCFSAFSQENETSNCPTVEVSGPAGIIASGNPAIYVVNVDTKGKSLNLEYI